MKKLSREFYLRDTVVVAKDLLGKYLVYNQNGNMLMGMIVESEAYRENDLASHSSSGKTDRNSAMFMQGGHLYVYLTYGIHYCANIVTEKENYGSAVLIRAVEPLEGIEVMKKNRKISDVNNLTTGPAKFCQAFGITIKQNKVDLTLDNIFCVESNIKNFQIKKSSRIGVTKATDKLWRFFIKDNNYVSKKVKNRKYCVL
jgi:DNA-3-methyladenine glycosylase